MKEINWFHSNLLTLNYDKTYFVQFLTKKQKEIKLQIVTSNSLITNINSTKFLGLTIDSTLSWKEHSRTDIKTEPGLLCDKNLKSIHITRGTQNNILLLFPHNHDIRHHILGKLIYQYQHLQNPKKDTENHDKYQKAGIVPTHI